MRDTRLIRVMVVLTVGGAVLAGCTSPDLSPVPTVAAVPYLCDGVPEEGAELTAGGQVRVRSTRGQWGGDWGDEFRCSLERRSGQGRVIVTEIVADTDEQTLLHSVSTNSGAEPIDADVPGGGYHYGDDSFTTAEWVCGTRHLVVYLESVDVDGRDPRADASAFLVSMLPWACDGELVPEQTVEE